MTTESSLRTRTVVVGTIAGLIGGLTEVAWIWFHAIVTDNDAGLVARAVADAVGLGDQTVFPSVGGVVIHMGLAAILGIAIASALRPIADFLHGIAIYAAVVAILAIVWAVNFFVVLPQISPQFVTIVPYEVSLVSKVLFGVAAAWVFQRALSARASLICSWCSATTSSSSSRAAAISCSQE
jgi:hypothetical protein